MRRLKGVACGLCVVSVAAAAACGGDDVTATPHDGGVGDASSDSGHDATGGDAGADVQADTNAPDTGNDAEVDAAVPQRLLLSYNAAQSELVAVDIATKAVDGRLLYPGFIGTTSAQGADPYLMEQSNDVVARLDRATPWVIRSSWNVKLSDSYDGGAKYSDPDAVIVGAGTKAYVLRYTRNQIAVIDDTSQSADAGAPSRTIDLASLVQANDADGIVEMTAGVYVPSKHLVYVLLGNINRFNVSPDGFYLYCSQTKSTVVAIDVATDKLVKLTGGNASGALELGGFNPVFGGLAYDRQLDRLLVSHAGCNAPPVGDAGQGQPMQRRVEELSLFTGETRTLFDATTSGFPSGFVYIDAHRAILQFDFTGSETYAWDPTQTTLGAAIAAAPDTFVYDGAGSLLGLSATYLADGGAGPIDVVSVRIADGAKTTLLQNPFTLTGGFIGGVDLWPPR